MFSNDYFYKLLFQFCSKQFDNKDVMIQEMQNAILCASEADILLIVQHIGITSDVEIMTKLFSLLGVAVSYKPSYITIITKNDHLFGKIANLLSGKVHTLCLLQSLRLLTVLVYSECEQRSLLNERLRDSGCLHEIALLFLSQTLNGSLSQFDNLVCKCLSGSFIGCLQNQNQCSHLIPVCISRLNIVLNEDLVDLLFNLVEKNLENKEIFAQKNGISLFCYETLQRTDCLQLLCEIVEGCHLAAKMAFERSLPPQLTQNVAKYGQNSEIGKWCSIALFHISNTLKRGPLKPVQVPRARIYQPNKSSAQESQFSKFKYIADKAKPTFSQVKIGDNIVYVPPEQKHIIPDYNWTQEISTRTNKQEISRNGSILDSVETYEKKNRDLFKSSITSIAKDQSFVFEPGKSSTPKKCIKQTDRSRLSNNCFHNSSTRKCCKPNISKIKQNYLQFSKRIDRKLSRNTVNITNSSKLNNTSLMKTELEISQQSTTRLTNLNQSMSSKIFKSISNSSIIRGLRSFFNNSKMEKGCQTGDDLEDSKCNSCNDTVTLKEKLESDAELQEVVWRLRLGLKVYGCNFKKMVHTFWRDDAYMTPQRLYHLYQKLILKNKI